MEGLKIIVGADITDAQAKLKKVVVDAKTTGKEIEKSFGNARLPLGNIQAYTSSVQALKQNLSQVTLSPLNEGIQKTGTVAQAAISGVTGLAGSLAQGALAGVVLFATHALIGLVKSLFETEDASKVSEAALKSFGDEMDRVKGSVKGLAEELQFANAIGALDIKIRGASAVTDLLEQSFAQRSFTNDLRKQMGELRKIGEDIANNEVLNDEDRIKAKEDNDKEIQSLNDKIIDSERKQQIIYKQIGAQRVDDQKEIDEKRLKDYKDFLRRLKELIAQQQALERSRNTGDTSNASIALPVIISPEVVGVGRDEMGEIERVVKAEFSDADPIKAAIKVDITADVEDAEKNAQKLAQTINGLLTPAFDGLFDAIKSGENPLKAFFEGLGNAVLQLIQQLIQAAITAAILSAIIPGGGGGFGAIFGKLVGFASGGLVSGPTIAAVGEGSGTNLSNPEVIAPLDKLKAMLGEIGTGGAQVVVLETRLRGNDIALGQARTSRRNKRLGATG